MWVSLFFDVVLLLRMMGFRVMGFDRGKVAGFDVGCDDVMVCELSSRQIVLQTTRYWVSESQSR